MDGARDDHAQTPIAQHANRRILAVCRYRGPAAGAFMTGLFTRMGARIDTWGAAARMARFRTGWPATATPQVQFHRTAKVQYRYLEAGRGQTIVFTCDPPMTIEVYGPLVEAFGAHFRVIVVELPAMGFSAATSDYAFGFRETHDDLASHLTLLQAGGTEAFAIWKAGRDPRGLLAKPLLGQLAMAHMAPRRMPQWYRLSVGRKEQIPHFCACAERSFTRGAMWSLASAYQIYLDRRDELPRPQQPILSIWGAADRSHPAGNAHSLARLYDGVRTVTFDDLGHTPELEAPDQVLTAILGFVR